MTETNNTARVIDTVIRQRRTVKPAQMNGNIIPDEMIDHLLSLADWAPTHGRTEPWRFIVYSGAGMVQFCQQHADLYKANMAPDKFKQLSYDKLVQASDGASHLVLAYMKRGTNPNIPDFEEAASVAAAIQNVLLGVTAHGYAAFWSTSGMVYSDALKDFLDLGEEDRVFGFLFLGSADGAMQEGRRSMPMSEKVKWVR